MNAYSDQVTAAKAEWAALALKAKKKENQLNNEQAAAAKKAMSEWFEKATEGELQRYIDNAYEAAERAYSDESAEEAYTAIDTANEAISRRFTA